MPADENTGYFVNELFEHRPARANHIVDDMLSLIEKDYDFVVMDTAPALSPMLTNALVATDGVIAVYQPEKYCYSAMFSLFETFDKIREKNPKLTILGILTTLTEVRRSDMQQFMDLIQHDKDLGRHVFKTVIRRRADTGRLSYAGFFNNPEVDSATKQYAPFVKEVLDRGQKN